MTKQWDEHKDRELMAMVAADEQAPARELPPNSEWPHEGNITHFMKMVLGGFPVICGRHSDGPIHNLDYSEFEVNSIGAGLWRREVARLERDAKPATMETMYTITDHDRKIERARAQLELWEAAPDKTMGGG